MERRQAASDNEDEEFLSGEANSAADDDKSEFSVSEEEDDDDLIIGKAKPMLADAAADAASSARDAEPAQAAPASAGAGAADIAESQSVGAQIAAAAIVSAVKAAEDEQKAALTGESDGSRQDAAPAPAPLVADTSEMAANGAGGELADCQGYRDDKGGSTSDSADAEAGDEADADAEEPEARPKVVPRKPLEPYEVPTAGAFFMHDDRFGGEEEKKGPARKPKKGLWSPADDVWVHDKFELLSLPPEADTEAPLSHRGRGGGGGRGRGRRGGYDAGDAYGYGGGGGRGSAQQYGFDPPTYQHNGPDSGLTDGAFPPLGGGGRGRGRRQRGRGRGGPHPAEVLAADQGYGQQPAGGYQQQQQPPPQQSYSRAAGVGGVGGGRGRQQPQRQPPQAQRQQPQAQRQQQQQRQPQDARQQQQQQQQQPQQPAAASTRLNVGAQDYQPSAPTPPPQQQVQPQAMSQQTQSQAVLQQQVHTQQPQQIQAVPQLQPQPPAQQQYAYQQPPQPQYGNMTGFSGGYVSAAPASMYMPQPSPPGGYAPPAANFGYAPSAIPQGRAVIPRGAPPPSSMGTNTATKHTLPAPILSTSSTTPLSWQQGYNVGAVPQAAAYSAPPQAYQQVQSDIAMGYPGHAASMPPMSAQGIPAPYAPQPQASGAAMARPVRRPITIEMPPEMAGQEDYSQQQPQQQRMGGRRYSAMTGHSAT